MANNPTLGVLLAVSGMVSSVLGVSCGARIDAVTETGNPSFIKDTRITATPLDGVIVVRGSAGAVPGGAKVDIDNESTNESSEVTADDDGSFELTVEGDDGDTVVLTVESDGQSETKRLQVEAASENTTESRTEGHDAGSTPKVPLNHRAQAETCDAERAPGYFDSHDENPPLGGECTRDADCVDGARGRCSKPRDITICTYDECSDDSQCSEGGPCDCNVSFGSLGNNTCRSGNCQVDNDCGDGGYCSPSLGTCGDYSDVAGYWCHTPSDDCIDDADCALPDEDNGFCMYSSEASHWVCAYTWCAG
jgi:hypothetical protein